MQDQSISGYTPPQRPHTSSFPVMPVVMVVVGLLVGGVIGYFARQPEVDTLRSQVTLSTNAPTSTSPQLSSESTNAAKSRDTERATDINAIATHLEVYYNDHASYPVVANLSDDIWVKANLTGMDMEALRPPDATSNAIQNADNPDKLHYGYKALQDDGKTDCSASPCTKYVLYWLKESTSQVQHKDSLN
jgi:hypothetical protein